MYISWTLSQSHPQHTIRAEITRNKKGVICNIAQEESDKKKLLERRRKKAFKNLATLFDTTKLELRRRVEEGGRVTGVLQAREAGARWTKAAPQSDSTP